MSKATTGSKTFAKTRFAGLCAALLVAASLAALPACSQGANNSSGGTNASQASQSGERLDNTYNPDGGYRHVSGDEAAKLMESEDCVVVDVRGQVDWDYMHIPGSVPISFDVIATEEGQAQLPNKDQMIILYCDYGGLSKIAAEDMVAAGYTNIVEFNGLEDWNGPLEGQGV